MAINLGIKYSPEIESAFSQDSYIKSHSKAKVDFTGAKTVRVYMLKTTALVDYQRSGSSRYGKLEDVQDTVIEYTMSQDKSFTGVVDKGDESAQSITNKAGQWLRQQIREQVVPTADKYALNKIMNFGHIATAESKPTSENIITEIFKARTWFNNHRVPRDGRFIYIPASMTPDIMLSKEWCGLDNLAGKQLPTGVIGSVAGFTIVEIPDYMFDENHFFTAVHEQAVAFPYKINAAKIHTDPVGINGAVIEGRQLYDVFVLGSKADAVYSLVLESVKQATPTITDSSITAVTLTSEGAKAIYYTLDGSDPRFSMTREIYTGAFNATGKLLKAVAIDTENKVTSDIAEKQIATE